MYQYNQANVGYLGDISTVDRHRLFCEIYIIVE